MLKQILFIISFYLIFTGSIVWAGWTGPEELMSTTYGDGADQIPILQSDMGQHETEREDIHILPDNRVAINMRLVKLFNHTGFIRSFSRKPMARFSGSIHLCDKGVYVDGGIKPGHPDNGAYFYNYSGVIIRKIEDTVINGNIGYVLPSCEFIKPVNGKYNRYSMTGSLVETYDNVPREIEKAKERESRKIQSGDRLTVVEYGGLTYSIKANATFSEYSRDLDNNLLAYSRHGNQFKDFTRVYKFDRCGKQTGFIELPHDDGSYQKVEGRYEEQVIYNAYYDTPWFSDDGDIYTWYRNETEYKILKWTWIDEPTDPKGGPDMPII